LSKDAGGEEGKDAASPANAFVVVVVVCGIRFCSFVRSLLLLLFGVLMRSLL
jgi:hypothetical protein